MWRHCKDVSYDGHTRRRSAYAQIPLQKLDTYVKTVLRFGDRPATTMAITVMRKTANMKKEEKPRAAEGILKNAYVDDICDSVNDVKEAKALMSDIDEVLDVSGLHVKQWISSEQSDI